MDGGPFDTRSSSGQRRLALDAEPDWTCLGAWWDGLALPASQGTTVLLVIMGHIRAE